MAPKVNSPKILVVDDDVRLRDLLSRYLTEQGFQVTTLSDARDLDKKLQRDPPHLVVLDLMMPGEDGLAILRRLRKPGGPAVIMLSAMGEDTDRIIGLEVGADDYLAKPCNPRELLARIRAVLRRRGEEPGGTATAVRRFGIWTLDIVQREVRRADGPAAPLTDAEFRVLAAFLDRPQRVLSRDQLIEAGKGADSDVFDRAIDVTISRLRKKLGPDDPIRTIRNEGYMFTLRVEGE